MRRADRLFQIVQHLRARRLTTAASLAQLTGVSERTVYRDIQDLTLSGVPIQGEAGVGYRLDRGYEVTSLMFTPEEVKAVSLGLRMAQAFAGPKMRQAAAMALDKIALCLPPARREEIERTRLYAPAFAPRRDGEELFPLVSEAIEGNRYLDFDYADKEGRPTRRRVRPLGLYFWGTSWTVATWCELRQEFRNFRLDRMGVVEVAAEKFPHEQEKSLDAFLDLMRRRYGT